MEADVHWYAGWGLIATGFVSGAVIGLGFHRKEFLGGYCSLRRRLLRLGHVALIALGMLNVMFSLVTQHAYANDQLVMAASLCWLAGGFAMPLVCFLSAWQPAFRHTFAVPVSLLLTAAVLTAVGGLP